MLRPVHHFKERQHLIDVLDVADVLAEVEAAQAAPTARLALLIAGRTARDVDEADERRLAAPGHEARKNGVVVRHETLVSRSSALALFCAIWFWLGGAAGFS